MDWRPYFISSALSHGRSLWRKGQVSDLRREGDNACCAVVHGSSYDFSVRVERRNNGRLSFSCECPFSKTENCMHESAAMFAIEQSYPEFLMGSSNAIISSDSSLSGYESEIIKMLSKKPEFRISVSVDCGLLDLDIKNSDMTDSQLSSLLEYYKRRRVYASLGKKSLPGAENEDLNAILEFLDQMHIAGSELVKGKLRLPLYRSLYINSFLNQRENIIKDRSASFLSLIGDFDRINDSLCSVPQSLSSVLRPYQADGFRWLRTMADYGFSGILADEMGLGKTVQVLSLLLSFKEEGKKGTSLVVCPASLVYNWEAEAERFTPSLSVLVISGNPEERSSQISSLYSYDLVITSYDYIKRDIASYMDNRFLLIAIDEAQYIKNHGTDTAKAVKLLKSSCRTALTGTPVENRLSELWSIFDFLMPGFLYSYRDFRSEFEIPIVRDQNSSVLERLRRMTSPFVMRRLKSDVLDDLPDKIEEVRPARMSDEQRLLYDAHVLRIRNDLLCESDLKGPSDKIKVLSAITVVRQLCCDPSLVYENYSGHSCKRELCIELIKSAMDGGHRVLVFSQFTSMLSLLGGDLKSLDIPYYTITGSSDKKERIRLADSFNSGCVPVFLISLRAGGTGLNLTGADVVIHYDPWWNTAVQNQATDRAHRIGQSKAVSVFRLIAEDTIEERILKMQDAKKDLADSILCGSKGGIGSLSRRELLEILS